MWSVLFFHNEIPSKSRFLDLCTAHMYLVVVTVLRRGGHKRIWVCPKKPSAFGEGRQELYTWKRYQIAFTTKCPDVQCRVLSAEHRMELARDTLVAKIVSCAPTLPATVLGSGERKPSGSLPSSNSWSTEVGKLRREIVFQDKWFPFSRCKEAIRDSRARECHKGFAFLSYTCAEWMSGMKCRKIARS